MQIMATNLSLNLLPSLQIGKFSLPNLNASQAPLLPKERERVHFPGVGEPLHDDVTHLPEILVLVQLSDLGHSHRLLGDQAPVELPLPSNEGTYIYLQYGRICRLT